MKVLKFGGTSVGSIDSIRQIQHIIAKQTDDCIVVVSALGGITDQLLKAAHLALAAGEEYMEVYQTIRQRHLDMINTLIDNPTMRQMLCHEIERILDELRSVRINCKESLRTAPGNAAVTIRLLIRSP